MNTKDLRERFDGLYQDSKSEFTELGQLRGMVGDLILYLEEIEKRPPVWVPEPRLGPQPESEEEAIERGKELAAIVKAAEDSLARERANESDGPPKLCTTSGKPIDEHTREINPATGMQKDYIVLCADERAKGFVRPYRDAYKHLTCGTVTTMGRALSETYARDPGFYSGTFCCGCGAHFPVGANGEFVWMDGERVGT